MVQFENKYGAEVELILTGTSLASGAGRISTQIDQDATDSRFSLTGYISVKTKTGGVAPTAGGLLELYLVRGGRSDGSQLDDNLGLVDAAMSVLVDNLELIGAIIVPNTANLVLQKAIVVENLPRFFSLFFWNSTSQTISATAADHLFHFQPIFEELV